MRALYRLHNGFPGDLYLSELYTLMPLAKVVETWTTLKEILDDGAFEDQTVEADVEVRPCWWHIGWIPVAEDGLGNNLCVDLAPTKAGQQGQLIEFVHDDSARKKEAASLLEWLGRVSWKVD